MDTSGFHIFSDSCCDLPKEYCQEHEIGVIPLYVAFSDGEYKRDFYDFTYHEFYQKMKAHPGDFPKTSLPGIEDYAQVFRPLAEAGQAILCLCMASAMSGSFNSARLAAEEIRQEFPEAAIEVVDTKALTFFQGLLVREAVGLRDAGKSLEETVNILEKSKGEGGAFFTIGDLSYLNKGGRIGGLVKLAAVGLGLKPVILFRNGAISLSAITRKRKKSLTELARQAAAYLRKSASRLEDYWVQVGYGLSRADGEELLAFFQEALRAVGFSPEPAPELSQIGTLVGAHNGPDLMGIAFLRRWSDIGRA